MADITTSLEAAVLRAIDSVVDVIAVEGIAVLKKILDEGGFAQSDLLKEYEVYAHVVGREIDFEILVPADAFDMSDAGTKSAVDQAKQEADEVANTPGVRTYGFQPSASPGRLTGRRDARRDARKSNWDARRDARKPPKTLQSKAQTAQSRLIEHQIAMSAPRSLQVNREGKVSLRMSRTVEDTPEGGVRMPQGKFQGVIGQFVESLQSVVAESFGPELEKVLARRLR